MNTGWNDIIVALEKTIWFHFRLMKTGFLFLFFFFVADHLLFSQLCTNPKCDRSLLSCLKVTQCSTSEIGDAPLYNSCSLPIQVITTGPLPAPSKCKSARAQLNASDDHLEVVERKPKAEDIARKTRTKEFIEKVEVIIDETPQRCGDPLVQSGGRWPSLAGAAGLGAGPQVQRDPGLASEEVLRLCTLLPLASLFWHEPTGPLRLVIRREHHQHDLPQHESQPDRRHPPSIRRVPAGKGMLPSLDTYRGCDWGWRRLHWIDVSSIT